LSSQAASAIRALYSPKKEPYIPPRKSLIFPQGRTLYSPKKDRRKSPTIPQENATKPTKRAVSPRKVLFTPCIVRSFCLSLDNAAYECQKRLCKETTYRLYFLKKELYTSAKEAYSACVVSDRSVVSDLSLDIVCCWTLLRMSAKRDLCFLFKRALYFCKRGLFSLRSVRSLSVLLDIAAYECQKRPVFP